MSLGGCRQQWVSPRSAEASGLATKQEAIANSRLTKSMHKEQRSVIIIPLSGSMSRLPSLSSVSSELLGAVLRALRNRYHPDFGIACTFRRPGRVPLRSASVKSIGCVEGMPGPNPRQLCRCVTTPQSYALHRRPQPSPKACHGKGTERHGNYPLSYVVHAVLLCTS
ncbi:hypothetical protein FA13DRAFT_1737488 [Coprinellus micaceus]|uniref:Uncharacterized protein n=1 Tax=Coprinellus micaceus TaxID=71717 RepID=A0A4Y7SX76_COPMI|nr:hypothetical protein FA13DRAFT_1737488 [Coprinellus micaceus]